MITATFSYCAEPIGETPLSETPRTDERCETVLREDDDGELWPVEMVTVEFAQELELEIAELRKQLKEASK